MKKKIESTTANSLEEVLKKCNIDTELWDVESFSTKELASGEVLWTTYFKPKRFPFDILSFKKELVKLSPEVEKIEYTKFDTPVMWEFNAPDAHLAKLGWAEESGESYDIKIAVRDYNKAVNDALNKVKEYKIEKIIFPLGNDYLHCDNLLNSTTAGTPQDADSRHLKMFRAGYKLLIETITKFQKIAPVEVIMVLGNHSTISEMHIGELLSMYFHNNPNVKINNSAFPRKYLKYGGNLIGYVHGNNEKPAKLPLLMATERPKDWATAHTKRWHTGHLHQMRAIQEECGVVVEVLSALSGPDAYHTKNGYIGNLRAATSFIYDKKEGVIARFYHKV